MTVVVVVYLSAAFVRWLYRPNDPVPIATTTSFPTATTLSVGDLEAVHCGNPPPVESSVVSPFGMSLIPERVSAGDSAELIISAPTSSPNAVMGVDLDWMCWDGSRWVMTHKLVTDDVATGPLTLEHPPPPGVTTTIPDLPVMLPSSSGILIPEVPPGTYRLQTSSPVGETTVPFVLVEVVS
jgi:hypothetical protein